MDERTAEEAELLYFLADKFQFLSASDTWMNENWEIMFVWRLLLFGSLWFWGIPRLLRTAKPNVYREEQRTLRIGLIGLYIFSESMIIYSNF